MSLAQDSDDRTLLLADGTRIPRLGLGVWQIPNGRACVDAVRWALDLGYRHIDTAQAYGNEESVGRGLRESGVPRDEVFLTTKFYPQRKDPVAQIERSLQRLGVERVDLYIIHWPERGSTWAWPGMERARELGHARSIGVSNFSSSELEELVRVASSRPVINQVQFSPFEYRRALFDAARRLDIATEAYSPLGTGRHLRNGTVANVAAEAGRTPAQVLLRWCLQRGTVAIPKSTHRARIAENADVFDFTLSAEQMGRLDALDRSGGTKRALERPWW